MLWFSPRAAQGAHCTAIDCPTTTDINDSDVIVGYYTKIKNVPHGFLYASGVATIIDYPGAIFTQPLAINAAGAVTGFFGDSVGVHGFVRASSRNISSFDPPGSGYTVPRSINASGEVAGFFYIGSAGTQGFLPDVFGSITVFSLPGASGAFTTCGARHRVFGFTQSGNATAVDFSDPNAVNTTQATKIIMPAS